MTKCQPWLLLPVGACVAISRHSRSTSGSTGREKSRRFRTERVVVSNWSGVSSSKDIKVFSVTNAKSTDLDVFGWASRLRREGKVPVVAYFLIMARLGLKHSNSLAYF